MKKKYTKPVLSKHGKLEQITQTNTSGVPRNVRDAPGGDFSS